jgi:hypothetical protein
LEIWETASDNRWKKNFAKKVDFFFLLNYKLLLNED